LLVAATTGDARAERVPGYEPLRNYANGIFGLSLEVKSTGVPVRIELYELVHNKRVVTCVTPCRSRLVPNRYRLVVAPTKSTVAGEGVMEFDRDSRVSVDPQSYGARYLGLGVALLGSALVLVGGVLFASRHGRVCELSYAGTCWGGSEGIYLGIPLMVAGLPLAINGWVFYGGTFGLDASVTPLSPERFASPRSTGGRSGLSSLAPTIALRLAF
jgi:hypothetical protein